METRYAERKKHLYYKSDQLSAEDDRNGTDRISDLPYEIVHLIFSFLPLDNVAKTCVLSKRWKYLWYSYPCLDFSTSFDSSFERDCRISASPYSAFQKRSDRINEVLRSLDNHLDVRILKFYGLMNAPGIVRSMRLAVKHNVQELDLDFFNRDRVDLPRCILNSLSLRDLRLSSSSVRGLRLPPLDATTKGCFKSLQSLYLVGSDFCNQSSLLNLFSDSLFPSLAKLHLETCSGLEHLRIQMSGLKDLWLENMRIHELDISVEKLEKLRVSLCFSVVGIGASNRVAINAPLLEFISWMDSVTEEFVIGKCDSLKEATLQFDLSFRDLSDWLICGFLSFLNGISHCPSLILDVSVFEILSRSNHLAGVQQPRVFSGLTSMEVKLSDGNCVIWDEDFSDRLGYTEDDIDWESQAQYLNLFLRHLKVVTITGFKECSNDVVLVKLLLNHAKALEQLLLLDDDEDSMLEEDTKSEIMEFPRASSNVQIIFQ